jgi:hypothetical protein
MALSFQVFVYERLQPNFIDLDIISAILPIASLFCKCQGQAKVNAPMYHTQNEINKKGGTRGGEKVGDK